MNSILMKLNMDPTQDIESDLNVLATISETFLQISEDSENAVIMNHIGNELSMCCNRLKSKFNVLTQSNVYRSEVSLTSKKLGFLSMNAQDIHDKINSSSSSISDLWQTCLKTAKGDVEKASRNFVNAIDKSGDFHQHCKSICDGIDDFNETRSEHHLKISGNWHDKLRRNDKERVKYAECALALAGYGMGDKVYAAPEIIHAIQNKHREYLLSLVE